VILNTGEDVIVLSTNYFAYLSPPLVPLRPLPPSLYCPHTPLPHILPTPHYIPRPHVLPSITYYSNPTQILLLVFIPLFKPIFPPLKPPVLMHNLQLHITLENGVHGLPSLNALNVLPDEVEGDLNIFQFCGFFFSILRNFAEICGLLHFFAVVVH
jgi:hypothetical protein